jgi:tetratricopeptide (TPR) repeat protein
MAQKGDQMNDGVLQRSIGEWFELGRACFHKPDGLGAVQAFERVVEKDPRYRHPDGDNPYFYLGKINEVEGRIDEAIVHYSRALAVNPHDEESMIGRASCLTVSGRHHEALGDLNRLLRMPAARRQVPDKILFYVMAENYRRLADWGQAVYYGRQALDADPGNTEFQALLQEIRAKTPS